MAQSPCSLLPLEGTRVLISPPDNETELSITNLRKETHAKGWRVGYWDQQEGFEPGSRAGPSLRTAMEDRPSNLPEAGG